MPIYKNPNSFPVHLIGPDGLISKLEPNHQVTLPIYYDRYLSKGLIVKLEDTSAEKAFKKTLYNKTKLVEMKRLRNDKIAETTPYKKKRTDPKNQNLIKSNSSSDISKHIKKLLRNTKTPHRRDKLVGKTIHKDATKILIENINNVSYPISNNIGVGILSYERLSSLQRLVDSINRNTDLDQTTIFISDDGSLDQKLKDYLNHLKSTNKYVILKNESRAGVAGNTNRLLRCLERFKYAILLNDDVEVLNEGWENFYVEAFKKTNMHHFIYREPGIYGANKGYEISINNTKLELVTDKPHGAVLAFTNDMLKTCGYFNEEYGLYGMEHVDWSSKAYEFGLQRTGYFDVVGSNKYFKMHEERSAVDSRPTLYRQAKIVFSKREKLKKIEFKNEEAIPDVTYVIPVKVEDRDKSIATVINNIRAQKFAIIDINIVEQDDKARLDKDKLRPINYFSAITSNNKLFNKSYAFNIGVKNSSTKKLILHDADMLVQANYTSLLCDELDRVDFSHLGRSVLYTDKKSSDIINSFAKVDLNTTCERMVGYFEGGSLGCTSTAYWGCGGFNEVYEGYGCEDCDFYARISHYTKYQDERSVDFLHLWHRRVNGWTRHHEKNKKIEEELIKLGIDKRIDKQRQLLSENGYKRLVERIE